MDDLYDHRQRRQGISSQITAKNQRVRYFGLRAICKESREKVLFVSEQLLTDRRKIGSRLTDLLFPKLGELAVDLLKMSGFGGGSSGSVPQQSQISTSVGINPDFAQRIKGRTFNGL